MKVKLLRKIRSRIVSVKFRKRVVEIEYYDRDNEVIYYHVFGKQDLLSTIRGMFGDFFAKIVECGNKKANFRRAKKKLNSPIKYSWEVNK